MIPFLAWGLQVLQAAMVKFPRITELNRLALTFLAALYKVLALPGGRKCGF